MADLAPAPGDSAEKLAPFPAFADGMRLMLEWSATVMQMLIDAQRLPLQAGMAWQGSLNDVTRELWDEWAPRFAGAASIDI